MNKNSRIYIAGHRGMVGSAILRKLEAEGYINIVTRTSKELDLRDTHQVAAFFEIEKPEYVFLAAAKVGGIQANNIYRGQFLYDNLMIQNNVIHQSYVHKVKKLLFLGSSCIYPKNAPQPMKEEHLLTGLLEQTNEPYAIAKIAGIKIVENYARQYGCNFTAVMPTNLYGPNDNYNLENSHVLPALLRKFHLGKYLENGDWDGIRNDLNKNPIKEISGTSNEEEILAALASYGIQHAKSEATQHPNTPNTPNTPTAIEIWGSGKPLREFMHVDDLADASLFVMQNYDEWQFLNVGSGDEISIGDLALMIKDIVGFEGELIQNTDKPDGTMRKLMDSALLNDKGWTSKIKLSDGITTVYKEHYKKD